MNQYNSNIHHRRSIRLKGYDYAQAGLYFITICCQDRAHLFGEVINEIMILNEYGKIAFTEWENSMNIRDNIYLHDFVIMPNHIHGIIEIVFKKANQDAGLVRSTGINPCARLLSPAIDPAYPQTHRPGKRRTRGRGGSSRCRPRACRGGRRR